MKQNLDILCRVWGGDRPTMILPVALVLPVFACDRVLWVNWKAQTCLQSSHLGKHSASLWTSLSSQWNLANIKIWQKSMLWLPCLPPGCLLSSPDPSCMVHKINGHLTNFVKQRDLNALNTFFIILGFLITQIAPWPHLCSCTGAAHGIMVCRQLCHLLAKQTINKQGRRGQGAALLLITIWAFPR